MTGSIKTFPCYCGNVEKVSSSHDREYHTSPIVTQVNGRLTWMLRSKLELSDYHAPQA